MIIWTLITFNNIWTLNFITDYFQISKFVSCTITIHPKILWLIRSLTSLFLEYLGQLQDFPSNILSKHSRHGCSPKMNLQSKLSNISTKIKELLDFMLAFGSIALEVSAKQLIDGLFQYFWFISLERSSVRKDGG